MQGPKPIATLAALFCLAGCQALSPDAREAPSVGTMVGDGGSLGAGEGWLVVDRADLVTPERTTLASSSMAVALDHYESILDLPGAPAELRAEALRRAGYLRVRQVAEGEASGEAALHTALARYRALFAEFPGAAGNDLALYQMARAHEMLGQRAEAANTLAQLVVAHPASPLYVDAAFRAGELYYQERALPEAADAYQRVLARGADADKLGPLAAYKLGWAQLMAGQAEAASTVFLDLLDRLLPRPDDDCTKACLRRLAAGEGLAHHPELGQDALRGLSLALMARGGVDALERRGLDGARAPVYYWALAAALRERTRFHDAAATYAAFAARYPGHRWAPIFGEEVITTYVAGGFEAPAMAARAHFVESFGANASYWSGAAPSEGVKIALRNHLEILARHHHARAQALPAAEQASAQVAAREAAHWYRRWLALMPNGSERDRVRMRYADALLESDALAQAAEVYRSLAYEARDFGASDDAALAEVQTRYRIAERASAEAAGVAIRAAIAASRRLAARDPAHGQRSRVLVRAAEEAFNLGNHDDAIALARDALAPAPADPSLAANARLLLADSLLASKRFAEAEAMYERALAGPGAGGFALDAVNQRLATAIYRQAEAARAEAAYQEAADAFLRVGHKAPRTLLAAQAHFDAGAMMVEAQDWKRASSIFARFLEQHTGHDLAPDAEKWLATAYEEDGRPGAAAPVYESIARRDSEASAVRREAQWKAAHLYDQSDDPVRAYRAYAQYVSDYPTPVESAQEVRMRLAELAQSRPLLPGNAMQWWQSVIAVEGEAGSPSTPFSELMAARAHLLLGRHFAERATQIELRHPLRVHLGERQRLMRDAIEHFRAAHASGFEALVTPASYAIGAAYEDLVEALQHSERPPTLRGFEKEAYELLLEDQIYPIEEQAIAAHRRNLDHLREGLWDEWIQASAHALSQLVPGRYARQERQENIYARFE